MAPEQQRRSPADLPAATRLAQQASEQRAAIVAIFERLHADRARLAAEVAALRSRLQADHQAAREVWSSLTAQMQQRRVAHQPEPAPSTAEPRGPTFEDRSAGTSSPPEDRPAPAGTSSPPEDRPAPAGTSSPPTVEQAPTTRPGAADPVPAVPPAALPAPAAPADRPDRPDPQPGVGQPGVGQHRMETYAHLARAARLLQMSTAAGEASVVTQQLAETIAGLGAHVVALLRALEPTAPQAGEQERRQAAEYAEGLRFNLATLVQEFERASSARPAPWLAPLHRQLADLLRLVERFCQHMVAEPWQRLALERAGLLAEAPALPLRSAGSDDLTAIRGIGTALQQRLNQIGIFTYAQLARSTPEQLLPALGGMAPLVRTNEWIAQARILAGFDTDS